MKNILNLGMLIGGLVVFTSGCLTPESAQDFRFESPRGNPSAEEIAAGGRLLQTPEFRDRVREAMHYPEDGTTGGSVDIQSLRVELKGPDTTELRVVLVPDIQQPSPKTQKSWSWGRLWKGNQGEQLAINAPAVFKAVIDVYNKWQYEEACRALDEKMEALYKTKQEIEEKQLETRRELENLRQEYVIFPPDNQTATMRHIRLLEQSRADLSVKIKAAQNHRRDTDDGPVDPLVVKAQEDLRGLLDATEQELESANESAKKEIGVLGKIEQLQDRIESLTKQQSAMESEMNQRRSSPLSPPIKLLPLSGI